jgi:vacuolar-type H+-ATPase subunit B/Vma2
MTDEQIRMLRNLIKDEIECAQIDGMEHGQWGWAEKQLDEGWKVFQESFNVDISTIGSDLLDAFHQRAINGKNTND